MILLVYQQQWTNINDVVAYKIKLKMSKKRFGHEFFVASAKHSSYFTSQFEATWLPSRQEKLFKLSWNYNSDCTSRMSPFVNKPMAKNVWWWEIVTNHRAQRDCWNTYWSRTLASLCWAVNAVPSISIRICVISLTMLGVKQYHQQPLKTKRKREPFVRDNETKFWNNSTNKNILQVQIGKLRRQNTCFVLIVARKECRKEPHSRKADA